jgi:pimeloyl-ACP methyl ester carboxylesterase
MLVWGEDDHFAPLWIGRDMLSRLTKRGANVSFNTISEAGHFVQEDQPEKIVPLLIEHWNKTENK